MPATDPQSITGTPGWVDGAPPRDSLRTARRFNSPSGTGHAPLPSPPTDLSPRGPWSGVGRAGGPAQGPAGVGGGRQPPAGSPGSEGGQRQGPMGAGDQGGGGAAAAPRPCGPVRGIRHPSRGRFVWAVGPAHTKTAGARPFFRRVGATDGQRGAVASESL
ncbi:hypothetical protein MRB53_042207 [Persea americana]|nr:hypothetical protein MRB53_042207 [Persea americana]